MSQRRARYDGPHPEVVIFDPEADITAPPIATLKVGEYTPADMPARIRDELTARDNFTEVTYTKPGEAKADTAEEKN